MHSLLFIFIVASLIFFKIEKTSAEQRIVLIEDTKTAPVALIKKESSLHLALPEKYDAKHKKIRYLYDDSKEEFITACPIPIDEMTEAQRKWINDETVSIEGEILSTVTRQTSNEMTMNCNTHAVPSMKKTLTKCGLSKQGKFYQIGYPISNPDKSGIEFISMYKICYSSAKGTIYSIHSFESSDLFFKELPFLNKHNVYYKSKFDNEVKKRLEPFKKVYYEYALVRKYDMPIHQWQSATDFLPNMTPITRTSDNKLHKNLINYDTFIRLISRQTQKKLTSYSGTYEYTKAHPGCLALNICAQKTPVKLFWRIIMDTEKHAVIMVTQHTPKECDNGERICSGQISMLKNFLDEGCIYTCSVDGEMLKLLDLDLAPTEIAGYLHLRYKILKEHDDPSSTERFVNISNLGGNSGFLDSLLQVDKVTATEVINIVVQYRD